MRQIQDEPPTEPLQEACQHQGAGSSLYLTHPATQNYLHLRMILFSDLFTSATSPSNLKNPSPGRIVLYPTDSFRTGC